MLHSHSWDITIQFLEDGPRTRAIAVLKTDAGTELRHEGVARRNPSDRDVPEIGDELAACRHWPGSHMSCLTPPWATWSRTPAPLRASTCSRSRKHASGSRADV